MQETVRLLQLEVRELRPLLPLNRKLRREVRELRAVVRELSPLRESVDQLRLEVPLASRKWEHFAEIVRAECMERRDEMLRTLQQVAPELARRAAARWADTEIPGLPRWSSAVRAQLSAAMATAPVAAYPAVEPLPAAPAAPAAALTVRLLPSPAAAPPVGQAVVTASTPAGQPAAASSACFAGFGGLCSCVRCRVAGTT